MEVCDPGLAIATALLLATLLGTVVWVLVNYSKYFSKE